MTDPPRFLADAMLGGLARWLRILGFDAAYEPHVADQVLVLRARADGRTLLTRDRRLHASEPRVTRCTRCNVPLLRLEEGEVPAGGAALRFEIPDAARERGTPVSHCPICGRVYWEGSHTRRMREAVARALGREL